MKSLSTIHETDVLLLYLFICISNVIVLCIKCCLYTRVVFILDSVLMTFRQLRWWRKKQGDTDQPRIIWVTCPPRIFQLLRYKTWLSATSYVHIIIFLNVSCVFVRLRSWGMSLRDLVLVNQWSCLVWRGKVLLIQTCITHHYLTAINVTWPSLQEEK